MKKENMNRKDLYNVAFQCARLREQGCAMGCGQCQYNIFNYGLPVTEASLLKANAYTDYYHRLSIHKEITQAETISTIGRLIILAIFCIFFIWACSSIRSCVSPKDLIPEDIPELVWLRDNPNLLSNIPIVFRAMELVGVSDVNGDGKVNCIDYSVYFRLFYGSEARVMSNRNDTMNHMYIRIGQGKSAINLEPQGTAERYLMEEIWGDRYNFRFSQDRTAWYDRYIGR